MTQAAVWSTSIVNVTLLCYGVGLISFDRQYLLYWQSSTHNPTHKKVDCIIMLKYFENHICVIVSKKTNLSIKVNNHHLQVYYNRFGYRFVVCRQIFVS